MNSTTRWKLATAFLAAIAGYSTVTGRAGAHSNRPAAAAVQSAQRVGGLPTQLRRPLRISASAAGISTADLVERILKARTVKEVQTLAEKLGTVGDNETIDQISSLVDDTRRGVPEAILGVYGAIGSEQAVNLLLAHVKDDRPTIRLAAIEGLGLTQSQAAESFLCKLAKQSDDSAQSTAISGLGKMATDKAVATLIELGNRPDYSTASAAVYALAASDTPAADQALRKLIDAADTRIAATALQSIDVVDEALFAKLKTIVRSGDYQLVNAALAALGKAGEGALPILKEAALRGNPNTRWAAVGAIADIATPKAIAVLGQLMNEGDRQCATAAASSLSWIGGSDARALIIEAAMGDRAQLTGALSLLQTMDGEDVDAALLAVVRDGSSADRRAALPRLLKTDKPEALAAALDLATKGTRNERYEAMRMLADSGSQKAYDSLVKLAGDSKGSTRQQAFEMLAQVRPGDPNLTAMLTDSLFSGKQGEASDAASILGRIGTEAARQALIKALGDKSVKVAGAAASALGQGSMTDEVKQSLLAAAAGNEKVKWNVMAQLVQAGAPEGYQLAMQVLDGKDAGNNAGSILWNLASQGTPEARAVLDHALTSKDPAVQVSAISAMSNNADDAATDKLLALTRSSNEDVRRAAMSSLGSIGGDKAASVLIDATRSGKVEDRVQAIQSMANLDDSRGTQQLASLMRDPDPQVVQAAIGASYNAGPEVDQSLASIVNDARATADLKAMAASQLRSRGADLDASTEQSVDGILGDDESANYGGYAYAHGCDDCGE